MNYPKFWSDDFDMDLLKVIPAASALLDTVADIQLWTHCQATTFDRLNHPCCWNEHEGLTAHFGRHGPNKPDHYYTIAPVVRCTGPELLRDAWPHNYRAIVDGHLVWDTAALWPSFETIMWFIRGWGRTQAQHDEAVLTATNSLGAAVDCLRQVARAEVRP